MPLWHNELYFDVKKSDDDEEIIVKCIPDLPETIEIYEFNNIYVDVFVSFTFSLLEQESITINIGKKTFSLPLNQLYLKQKQRVVLKGQGLSQIIDEDIYNVYKKSDIICKIFFIK